ncbi:MAG: serine/threonine-protein kinase [Myxococcales bacterium]
MSQRFIRCPHCGLPHDGNQVLCPATGRAIDAKKNVFSRAPLVTRAPALIPAGRVAMPPPPRPPANRNAFAIVPNRQSRDLIGKQIGAKYVVRAVLGEGGMGTVYEAEHMAIGRAVAIKVLHPSQAKKKDAVKRFHQEARAAGAIGHPNICEVYDLGTMDDGSPYLVMEKLVGETLADRIASEGGLPFDDVIDVITQVLSGLVVAHEKGIVHRDIKPENVFLTKRVGCPALVKLLDFGVSKMIAPLLGGENQEDLDLTRTGMVMGTPYYMSPEQARGDRNLDARVDLFACGVIMYEALTGRRPYTAANYNALLLQILTTKPRPARDFRPALPLGFDEVLEKAMARARDDRFADAAAFQRDLQGLRDRHAQGAGLPAMGMGRLATKKSQATTEPPAPKDAGRLVPAAAAAPNAFRAPRVPSFVNGGATERPSAPDCGLSDDPDDPSSVEIPITFASETPMSGEAIPVEPTEVAFHPLERFARNQPDSEPADHPDPPTLRPPSAESEDELATQLGQIPLGLLAKGPDSSPSRRALFSETLAGVGEVVRALSLPAAVVVVPTAADADDGGETLVKVRPPFPKLRPRPPQHASAEDTINDNLSAQIEEAHKRVQDAAPRPAEARKVPKVPRP